MSEFSCEVVRVEIEPHPNADAIELAKVGDYVSIVQKGQFLTGDMAIYIPEAAIVPDWLLENMGLQGKLAGPEKNRVKAIRLRGIFSQGLLYPAKAHTGGGQIVVTGRDGSEEWFSEGEDASSFLGITKYEPPIPTHMSGRLKGGYYDFAFKYDFENIKKRNNLIEDGEQVVFTEKIHGTFMVVGVLPEKIAEERDLNRFFVSSKGLFANGHVLDWEAEENQNNLYVKTVLDNDLFGKLMALLDSLDEDNQRPMYLMGEVFGAGVQDLSYGSNKPQFRAFDMAYKDTDGRIDYVPHDALDDILEHIGVERVPVLYRGPFNKARLLKYTEGKETVSGSGTHVREGIVVRPVNERTHPRYGRVIVKSVSEAYLTRKNATEYN